MSWFVEEDEIEDNNEESFSEEEEPEEKPKGKSSKDDKPRLKTTIDLAKLPFLDNNGLNYLPTMQYFPRGKFARCSRSTPSKVRLCSL
jgi:hypothetical protein